LPDAETLLRRHVEAQRRQLEEGLPTLGLLILSGLALIGAACTRSLPPPLGSTFVRMGLLMLLLCPLLVRVAGFAWRGLWAQPTATLAVSGMAGAIGLGASIVLCFRGFQPPSWSYDMAPGWFPGLMFGVVLVAWIAATLASRCVVPLSRGALLRRLTLVLWAMTALCCGAALRGGWAEFDRARYLQGLPARATLRVSSLPLRADGSNAGAVGEFWVAAHCYGPGDRLCSLGVTAGSREVSRPIASPYFSRPDDPLTLWHDASRGLIFLQVGGAPHRASNAHTGRQVAVSVTTLQGVAGTPRAWALSALLGLCLSGVLLVRRARLDATAWVPGTVRDGRVWLEGGSSLRVESHTPYEGPVLVPSQHALREAYRAADVVDAVVLLHSTPAELTEAVRAAATNRDAMALAALTLTAAPLWTAIGQALFG
jgi:hypothetical protein